MGTIVVNILLFLLEASLLLICGIFGVGIIAAAVMGAQMAVTEFGGDNTVGNVFIFIGGFIFGLVCPFWWIFCLFGMLLG